MAKKKAEVTGLAALADQIVAERPAVQYHGFPVEMWPIGRPKRYPNNPRKNEAAIGKSAASLREFGWRQPIVVDEQDVIVVGDTRFLAAQLLRHETVPVHVARGLTPDQVRAYRLADNRVGEEAEWDTDRLLVELQALQAANVPLEMTGFEDAELDDLLGSIRGLQPHADPEAIPPLPVEPKSKKGEVYRLGTHVLICGDSCVSATWNRLFQVAGIEEADLLWTDPPYDVDYEGGTKKKLKILNDSLGFAGTLTLLRSSLGVAMIHLKSGAAMYVCAPHGPQFYAFAKVGIELGFWRQTILWIKDSFAFGRSDFHYRHEAILVGAEPNGPEAPAAGEPVRGDLPADLAPESMPFAGEPREVQAIGYGWKPTDGGRHPFYGGRKQDTGWEVDRPRVNDDHPTAKPVELVERALLASSKRGDTVLDCFAGGGSCLIAAEMHGRRCVAIELDPRFVDVILQRWTDATGGVPERVEAGA